MGVLPRYDAAVWRAFAQWGATKLPRWWLRGSPGVIGVLVGGAQARVRRRLIENQRLMHGRRSAIEESRDVARTLSAFGHCLGESLAKDADDAPRFVYEVEGRDHLVRALDAKRGAVMVTGHVGSWDVAAGIMAQRGFDVAIAMAPEQDARARAISDRSRVRVGVKVIHVGDDPLAALPLARHVREGGAVALQIDRVPAGMRAYRGTLFGVSWRVPVGPFQLAMATGAPIIPVFTARLGYAHYLMHTDPWIELPRRASEGEIEAGVASALRALERFIRRFPTQWFHFGS